MKENMLFRALATPSDPLIPPEQREVAKVPDDESWREKQPTQCSSCRVALTKLYHLAVTKL